MKFFLVDNVRAYLLARSSTHECIEFEKGMYLDSLEYHNLPSHITDSIDEYVTDDIKKGKIFIIYIKRKYWKIDNTNSLQICKY